MCRMRRGPGAPGLAPLFFASGALAISAQVVLLRELLVSLQGDETALGLGLAAWLAGIAGGAAVARRGAGRRPHRWTAAAFALLAVWGWPGIALARLGRLLLAPPPGEILSLGPSLALAVAVAAPAGALVGILFTSLAALASAAGWPAGDGIARLYVLEALGSLAAGLATTFVVVPLLPPIHGAALAGALCALAAVPATRAGLIPGRAAFPLLALALALSALPPLSSLAEEATERARFRAILPGLPLLAWADTPYQHAAVAGGEVRHLYEGGQYAGSFPDGPEHEVEANVLACLSPRPARVLAVGRLPLGGLRFLLRHPVERVDLVEIDRRAHDLVRRHLPREDAAALDDPRVRVVFDDPRRFLARSSARYDLIAVQEPDPVTLFLARLSTVEFFGLVSRRLGSDGVFVMRLGLAPNVLTGGTAALGGAVFGALREVFPVVRAGPGPDGLLVAGFRAEAATLDPATLAERFRERRVRCRAFAPEMLPGLFPPERVASLESELRDAASKVEPSRDERPVSFLHALAIRQRISGSALAPALRSLGGARRWIPAALLSLPSVAVLLLVLGRRARGRDALPLAALHAAAVTGACGMTWSLVLLFAFQTRAGALYGRLGLLTAVFMLGLAAGGFAARKGAGAPAAESSGWLAATSGISLAFAALVGPAVGAVLSASGGGGGSAAALGALLLFAGMATGAVFPVAAGVLLSSGRDAGRAAGAAECADHAGAAGAALLSAVALVPAVGARGACAAVAVLQVLSAAAVLAAVFPRRGRGEERGGS